MRILHILNHIEKIGNGIVNVTVDLACLQAQAGHQVAVASGSGEYEQLLSSYNVQYFPLDQSRNPVNIILAAIAYRQIIARFRPDVVHAHMMTGIVLAWTFRGRDKYTLISTVHNEFQKSSILMGLADRVIAVSDAVATSMSKRGIPEQKLRVVRNGTIGSPRSRPISEYQPLQLQHPSITTVAGMYSRKGISELISAFAQIASAFPEAHLYIVGDGPDRLTFETEAQRTSANSRIHFEGFQTSPQSYLLGTDIFVLASYRDPFPLVIPEAREAGCAIIATDVDGIPEALDNGQAGWLVKAKDADSLASALSQLLSNHSLLSEYKQRAGYNLTWLNVTRVSQETLAVYQNITKLPPPFSQ